MRASGLVVVLVVACTRAPAPLPPVPAPPAPPPQPVPRAPEPPRREPTAVYGLDEAVDDALSGAWTYLGTGPWTGNQRVEACAYRNERVLIVDVYCTIKEVQAFRVDVFSPTRGRVRIYAEARVPVSTLTRRDYLTFTAESEPRSARLPPVSLTMSFDDLSSYDRRRYGSFLPSCYGGVEIGRRQGGCLGALAGRAPSWAAANRAFLDDPPESWYRLVRETRALATLHGRDPR